MAYQTLLVNLSNEAVVSTVLAVAERLADRHSAHLLGLHIKPPLDIAMSAEMSIPLEVTRQFAEQQREVELRVKTVFEKLTDKSNFVAEWRSIDAGLHSIEDVLVEQGNTADLLILGQDSNGSAGAQARRITEHVLIGAGRPVLIVPAHLHTKAIGERVLVAWDGRRESTRALFGALPMIRRASAVQLLRINQPHQDRHHVVGVTEELANTLSRHGVQLEVLHSDARSSEIAEELLGYARDMDADTLIMGCYGHSPIRDYFLGSTTRQVLADATISVLMSN